MKFDIQKIQVLVNLNIQVHFIHFIHFIHPGLAIFAELGYANCSRKRLLLSRLEPTFLQNFIAKPNSRKN